MPTYIYKCECGETFETQHAMFYASRVKCPYCDSDQTCKVPTAPACVVDWKDIGDEGAIGAFQKRFRRGAVPQSVRGG